MITSWSLIIAKAVGRHDLAFVVPALNRPKAKFLKTVGLFVNLIPIRLPLPDTLKIDESLDIVSQHINEDLKHQFYQYNHFIYDNRADKPEFYMYFNFEDSSLKMTESLDDYVVDINTSKFDMDLNLRNYNNTFRIELIYQAGKYDPERVEKLMENYVDMLYNIADSAYRK